MHIDFAQRASGFFQVIEDNWRHHGLRQVRAAKEGLCIYSVDGDVEGNEFVHPPVATRFWGTYQIGHSNKGSVLRKFQIGLGLFTL